MTPLHWAVEKQHDAVVELLLQYGADPTLISKFDKTPISIALEYNRYAIYRYKKFLLQNLVILV